MIMRRILFFPSNSFFSETFRSTLLAISAHTISGFFFLANETQWGQQETITNWRELRDFLVIRLD